ncbi:ankyrin repeat domain-containing protein [Empedobacter falsenii]|nr:ankyrin repeat domain-containing protein [Flavobacteriaceae bacterium]
MARAGRPLNSNPISESISYKIEKGNIEEVKNILIENKIDLEDSYLRTPLIWASFYNNVDLLIWLIDNGANINHQDKNGYSALHFVAQENCKNVVEILLNNGIDVELEDFYGNTALWTAVFNAKGNNEIVELLLDSGANFNHLNKNNKTPKEMAETFGGFEKYI